MRKFLIVFLSAMLLLSGCFGLAPAGPESVEIDGKTYKTGFYGTLYPCEYPFTEHTLRSDDLILVQIQHDTFELYHADVGPYVDGTIYCEASQYDNLLSYYADPANYSFYCTLGVDMLTGETAQTTEIPDVDPNMFEELLRFAEASYYDPFDSKHNSQIETEELPMPDDTAQTRLVFYKKSKDSLFISNQGYKYYIINDHLYFIYQYDFDHGEHEKLIAVRVPDNISAYFVAYMKPYLKKR